MRIKLLFAAVFAISVSGVASATITFTDGDDFLVTNAENYEEIAALGELHAGGGDDYINVGGSWYELSNITLYGEEGNDTLWGSAVGDVIDGGPGDDTLYGGDHISEVWGGPGNDTFANPRGNEAKFYYRGLDEIRGFMDHFDGFGPSWVYFTEFTVDFLKKYLFAIPTGNFYYNLGLRGHGVGIFANIGPFDDGYPLYPGRSIFGVDGGLGIAEITVPEPGTIALFMVGLFGLWRIKRRSLAA